MCAQTLRSYFETDHGQRRALEALGDWFDPKSKERTQRRYSHVVRMSDETFAVSRSPSFSSAILCVQPRRPALKTRGSCP
jgi:hypothetical protein